MVRSAPALLSSANIRKPTWFSIPSVRARVTVTVSALALSIPMQQDLWAASSLASTATGNSQLNRPQGAALDYYTSCGRDLAEIDAVLPGRPACQAAILVLRSTLSCPAGRQVRRRSSPPDRLCQCQCGNSPAGPLHAAF
jgi:hypothetical protein